MIRALLLLLLVGCSSPPTPGPTATPVSKWKEYRSETGAFRIQFPGTPEATTVYDRGVKTETVAVGDYKVVHRPLDASERRTAGEITTGNALRRIGSYSQVRQAYSGAVPGLETDIGNLRARVYLNGYRLLVLTCPQSPEEDAKIFMDSFFPDKARL